MAVEEREHTFELLNGTEETGEQYRAMDARTAAEEVMASLPLVASHDDVIDHADEYALIFGLRERDTSQVHVYEGWAWKENGGVETYVQHFYTTDLATYREQAPDTIDTLPWCQ